jgi:HAD superfamily hydrolase (TIGR01459 family)
MSIPILAGVGAVAQSYDGFIIDIWGVLHDGMRPYPGVLDALERLKQAGKRVVVLSNAPRRADPVAQRMAEIGIPRALYHALHSSGEEVWQHLRRRDDAFYAALGRRCFHIGPPRDDGVTAGVDDLVRVESVAEAEFVLNTGPWGWDTTTESYEAVLHEARARDLPMVCANADLVVMHRGRRMLCAGALAQRYEELGGRVRWHGKPYLSVYTTCFALLGIADRRRILALGDSLRTDIAGARNAGIDSVLVTSGIHAEALSLRPGEQPDPEKLAAAIADSDVAPTAVLRQLAW